MNQHDTPVQCKGNGMWKRYIKAYPDLSLSDRADLDAHINEDHCVACKTARDELMAAMNALKAHAPDIEARLDDYIFREAEEAKPMVVESVMAHIAAIEAEIDKEAQPASERVIVFPRWRAAHEGNTSHARHVPQGAKGMRSAMALLWGGLVAFVTSIRRTTLRFMLAPVRHWLVKLIIAVLTSWTLAIAWTSLRRRFKRRRTGRRLVRVRHATILLALALFVASVLISCGLAATVLHSIGFHGRSAWWNYAIVTGVATTLSTICLILGVLALASQGLRDSGWDLSTVGKQLFVDGHYDYQSKQLDTTVQALLGIDSYDTAIALSFRQRGRDRNGQHGPPRDAYENELAQRMERFAVNLRRISPSASDPWRVTWHEFQYAWADAFNAPDFPPRNLTMADYARRVFEFERGLHPDDVVICQWVRASKEAPNIIVCASGVSALEDAQRPRTTERRTAVGQTFTEPVRTIRRMPPREVARLKQQLTRQTGAKSSGKSAGRSQSDRSRGPSSQPSGKTSKQRANTPRWAAVPMTAPSRLSALARCVARVRGAMRTGLPVSLAAVAACWAPLTDSL